MRSTFERLPTEIWFEIFDYLTIFDIFHGFIRLNQHINDLLAFYPLKLDFRQLSRTQFDLICRSIHSKQIISLCLSEELIPNQVQLFQKHFPHFHNEFRQLKTLKYVDTSTVLSHLPQSLSSLAIRTYLKIIDTVPLIIELLNDQCQQLTSLQIDGSYVFQTNDHSFSFLTHLTIDYCTFKEFRRILHSLKSPLTHLSIFLDQQDHLPLPSFERLVTTLQNLHVTFSEGKSEDFLHPLFAYLIIDIVMSFTLIKRWINELSRLITFIIQSTATLDMINGQLWEEYLLQTNIRKFHFKFLLVNHLDNENDHSALLQPFRSPFWLEKSPWYVVCERGKFRSSRPLIYSLPHFQSTCIFHPSNHFLSTSTDHPFISSHSIHLILTFHQIIPTSTSFFHHVSSLTLMTTTLPSVELLQSMLDLKQIQQFDVSFVKMLSLDLFYILIDAMKNLKVIKMQYVPFYIPPLHIYSYIFIRNDQHVSVIDSDNIERFVYLFFHLKFLEITIQSEDVLVRLLNRLHYLETIRIFSYDNSLQTRINDQWLRQNIPRLKMIDFTFRTTSTSLLLSIGNQKVIFLLFYPAELLVLDLLDHLSRKNQKETDWPPSSSSEILFAMSNSIIIQIHKNDVSTS